MLETTLEVAREAERAGSWQDALYGYETSLWGLSRGGGATEAAEILRAVGRIHFGRGDLELARDAFETSLAVAEGSGLRGACANALNCLAVVAQQAEGLEPATALFRRARAVAEETGDVELAAMIDQNLGTLANIRGDREGALRHYGEARSRFVALGDAQGAAWVLNNVGMVHVDAAEWDAAEAAFEEAHRLSTQIGDVATEATVAVNRGELWLRRLDFAAARDCCDRAFELYSHLDSKPGLGEVHKVYGMLYREWGKPRLAEMHLLLAQELARISEDALLAGEVAAERAVHCLRLGQFGEALRCLEDATELFARLDARRDLLDVESRLQEVDHLFLELATRWSAAAEGHDPFAVGHAARVAEYARRLAVVVGVEGRELERLQAAAHLHEAWKRQAPAPGSCIPAFWGGAEQPEEARERILRGLGTPDTIRAAIRSTGEHWDGTGRPDRLAGAEIPLGARILAIAEMYDRLTTSRLHRPALSRADALRVLAQQAGRVLDPALFDVFREVMSR